MAIPSTTGSFEPLQKQDIHEASMVLVSAFDQDPVFLSFRDELTRKSICYAVFCTNIAFVNFRTTRVRKNENGQITTCAVYDDEQICCFGRI